MAFPVKIWVNVNPRYLMEFSCVNDLLLIDKVTDLVVFFGLGEAIENLTCRYSRRVCLHIAMNELNKD